MSTDTRALMASIGQTTVAEILGDYQALLDRKHNLEIEAMSLRNAGALLASTPVLTNCQERRDVDRRLGLYAALSTEAALLCGVPA